LIKSLELTIALVMLFGFLVFAYQMYGSSNCNLEYEQQYQNIINLLAKDSGFRESVNLKNVDLVYDIFYPYINQNYLISVCESLDDNCVYSSDEVITTKNIAYDYYFIDLNKTLYIIIY